MQVLHRLLLGRAIDKKVTNSQEDRIMLDLKKEGIHFNGISSETADVYHARLVRQNARERVLADKLPSSPLAQDFTCLHNRKREVRIRG